MAFFALITTALVFSLRNPLVWFILFGWFGFGVVLVLLVWFVVGLFGGGCHIRHDGKCFGKGIATLFYAFGITGPSISEKHVQGA